MAHDTFGSGVAWRKTPSGTYERALDPMEKFFELASRHGQECPQDQNWRLSTGIRINAWQPKFVADLKVAWKGIRYLHPSLAAVLSSDRWVYRPASPDELESWFRETFHVHDTSHSARELFPFPAVHSRRTVLHVLPKTQELVLQGPHAYIDAIGSIMVLDRLLQFLVSDPAGQLPQKLGGEEENLADPLVLAVNVPPTSAKTKAMWDAAIGRFGSNLPTIGLSVAKTTGVAKDTKLLWLALNKDETKSLAIRGKQLGLTVTASVQAAISRAIRKHGQVTNETHCTFTIHNGRKFLEEGKYLPNDRICTHSLVLPAVLELADGFLETARFAKKTYHEPQENGFLVNANNICATTFVAMMSAPPPPGAPPNTGVQLSSIGVVDPYLKARYEGPRTKFDVESVWATLNVLSTESAIHVLTFREEMIMQVCYNEAFHEKSSVALFLEMVRKELEEGLDIELEGELRAPGQEYWLKK